ncbi:hypothetical protein Emag_005720 [Eimeria magna]
MSHFTHKGAQQDGETLLKTPLLAPPNQFSVSADSACVGISCRRWEAESCGQRRASFLKTWRPIFLRAVVFSLMLSLCHHCLRSSTLPGILLWRVGEGDIEGEEDLPNPQSVDLAELCVFLENWTPDLPSTGRPRASPGLVEAALASVETEVESEDGAASRRSAPEMFDSGVKASVSCTGLKRLLFNEDVDEVDQAGPSSKMARTDRSTAIKEQGRPHNQRGTFNVTRSSSGAYGVRDV